MAKDWTEWKNGIREWNIMYVIHTIKLFFSYSEMTIKYRIYYHNGYVGCPVKKIGKTLIKWSRSEGLVQ